MTTSRLGHFVAKLLQPAAVTRTVMTDAGQRHIIHLNHAGASPSPPEVVDRVVEHLRLEQRVGGYQAAHLVANELESVYAKIAELVQCQPSEVALVESATVGWTRLFYAFAEHLEQQRLADTEERRRKVRGQDRPEATTNEKLLRRLERRVILVSQAEYAANLVAACQWCRRHPHWTVYQLPSVPGTGKVDITALEKMLLGMYPLHEDDSFLDPESIAMVCITHIPTNSGVVNPVEEIGLRVKNFNLIHRSDPAYFPIVYLVDACQSIGQRPVSARDLHCHGLVGTGRKYLRGPRGTGFLFASSQFWEHNGEDASTTLWPSHLDHFAAPVRTVPFPRFSSECVRLTSGHAASAALPAQGAISYMPRPDARRFEFWESSVALRLGLGVAVQVALDRGLDAISRDIREVANQLCDRLRGVEWVHIEYPPECGIVTFWVEGVQSQAIKNRLWDSEGPAPRCEVSVSPATSTPLDSSATNSPDLVRASVSYSTTRQELEDLVEALKKIIKEEHARSDARILCFPRREHEDGL